MADAEEIERRRQEAAQELADEAKEYIDFELVDLIKTTITFLW